MSITHLRALTQRQPPNPNTQPTATLEGIHYQWQIHLPNPERTFATLKDWNLDNTPLNALLTHLLYLRGITTRTEAEAFLQPALHYLYDPFLLPDMETALLTFQHHALQNRSPVFIVSDYDVDGVAGAAILVRWLNSYHIPYEIYIPDRRREGYGLAPRAIAQAHTIGAQLLILIDIGTRDIEEITRARLLGMDVLVFDHHEVDESLHPAHHPATAFVNPKRPDSQYPFRDLSGAAVLFKFLQAIAQRLQLPYPEETLELVALSICADIVPVIGENRHLLVEGLNRLQNTKIPGLRLLMHRTGIHPHQKKAPIEVSDIVYYLAPRLNAAGRIRHAREAFYLLTAHSENEALHWADQLCKLNQIRQKRNETIGEEALRLAKPYVNRGDPVLVLASPNWDHALVGINAARLAELFCRPVFLLAESEQGLLTGSGRSFANINLLALLTPCAHYLLRYGGHAQAVGLSLEARNLNAFRQCLQETYRTLYPHHIKPQIIIDAPLALLHIHRQTLQMLHQLHPFGPGNERPVFLVRDLWEDGYSRTFQKGWMLSFVDPLVIRQRFLSFQNLPPLTQIRHKRLAVCYQIYPDRKQPTQPLPRLVDLSIESNH